MNVVWFKRDLRLHDHEALQLALQKNKPLLLLYIFEDIFESDAHYSERHFRFIEESLADLQKELLQYRTKLLITKGDALDIFLKLHQKFRLSGVYSHQETGIDISYRRDKIIATFLKKKELNG